MKNPRSGYAAIPRWIIDTTTLGNLKPASVKVLLAIASYADDDGSNTWPSYERIATHAGCSTRAAKLAVDDLRKHGVIEVLEGGGRGRSNRYRIIRKPCTQLHPLNLETVKLTSPFDAENGEALRLETVKHSARNGEAARPKTVKPASPDQPHDRPHTITMTKGGRPGGGAYADDDAMQTALRDCGINRASWPKLCEAGITDPAAVRRTHAKASADGAKNPAGLTVQRLLDDDIPPPSVSPDMRAAAIAAERDAQRKADAEQRQQAERDRAELRRRFQAIPGHDRARLLNVAADNAPRILADEWRKHPESVEAMRAVIEQSERGAKLSMEAVA